MRRGRREFFVEEAKVLGERRTRRREESSDETFDKGIRVAYEKTRIREEKFSQRSHGFVWGAGEGQAVRHVAAVGFSKTR